MNLQDRVEIARRHLKNIAECYGDPFIWRVLKETVELLEPKPHEAQPTRSAQKKRQPRRGKPGPSAECRNRKKRRDTALYYFWREHYPGLAPTAAAECILRNIRTISGTVSEAAPKRKALLQLKELDAGFLTKRTIRDILHRESRRNHRL
ncbi:hypothetical protein [Nitratireductor sp. CH_MIT9313-5]|uniref:hypothetical protein n=1 Tax=Nitratireductor sp. CH_MIT9313-5 TaxID=3107764 RepID=UPI00300A83EB